MCKDCVNGTCMCEVRDGARRRVNELICELSNELPQSKFEEIKMEILEELKKFEKTW